MSIRFGKQLHRIAYNILGNPLDAEECTNDTYSCLPVEDMELVIDARELGRTIDRFLESKSKDSRYIFIRRYWFGDSVGEIAKELKMQGNAVSVRLNRIRNSLKEYLKKEGDHYEA